MWIHSFIHAPKWQISQKNIVSQFLFPSKNDKNYFELLLNICQNQCSWVFLRSNNSLRIIYQQSCNKFCNLFQSVPLRWSFIIFIFILWKVTQAYALQILRKYISILKKLLQIKIDRFSTFHFDLNSYFFPAKEMSGNGRSPLLQDPLYGSRPQPYSKYLLYT